MTVGGVDTYYDYEEQRWKYRRLGGGPVRQAVVCPEPRPVDIDEQTPQPQPRRTPGKGRRTPASA
ncbi:hypothetical protein [Kribbella sp. NPDC000426]|uniref:hypothetical protein n=1 Tax=Kribbella sp. NPDC000426 TaxID=3154255 RepID=UPI00332BDDCB